jgi:hypothetical protein
LEANYAFERCDSAAQRRPSETFEAKTTKQASPPRSSQILGRYYSRDEDQIRRLGRSRIELG